jgi:hypothetical protein
MSLSIDEALPIAKCQLPIYLTTFVTVPLG